METILKPHSIAASTCESMGHSLKISPHGMRADSAAARPRRPYHSIRSVARRSGGVRKSPLNPMMMGERADLGRVDHALERFEVPAFKVAQCVTVAAGVGQ